MQFDLRNFRLRAAEWHAMEALRLAEINPEEARAHLNDAREQLRNAAIRDNVADSFDVFRICQYARVGR